MADPAGQYASAVAALTAVRRGRMVDACRTDRPAAVSPTPTLDEDGKPLTGPPPPPVYEGPCALSDPESERQADRTLNDDAGVPSIRALQLPADAPEHRPGDVVTVTTSRFAPGLVGDTFVVLAELERTYATHRRYRVRGSSWLAS